MHRLSLKLKRMLLHFIINFKKKKSFILMVSNTVLKPKTNHHTIFIYKTLNTKSRLFFNYSVTKRPKAVTCFSLFPLYAYLSLTKVVQQNYARFKLVVMRANVTNKTPEIHTYIHKYIDKARNLFGLVCRQLFKSGM